MEQHNVVPFLLIRPRQLHGRIQDTVKIKAERICQVFSDDLSWYIAEIFFARQNRLDNPAGKCGQECGLLTSFYVVRICLLYTSPSPRDRQKYRMPSSA